MKRRLLFALAAIPFLFKKAAAQTQVSPIQVKRAFTITQSRLTPSAANANSFDLGGPISGLIFLNGLLQSPTTDYTITNNSLTFIPAYTLTGAYIVTYVKFI